MRSIPKSEAEAQGYHHDSARLYLNHDGEDERLPVEFFENQLLGNITYDSAEVDPVSDMAFLMGKRFCYFFA